MSMHVALQKDAEGFDERPIFDFCQWARHYDSNFFITDGHYSRPECHSDILDLGLLWDNLNEVLEDWDPESSIPKPPDIRDYLDNLINKEKIYHCWVSW